MHECCLCAFFGLHKVTQGYLRWPKYTKDNPRLTKVAKCYLRLPKVACSFLRFYRHFNEQECSFMTLRAVPWVYMKYHGPACSSMSLYAVPFFVEQLTWISQCLLLSDHYKQDWSSGKKEEALKVFFSFLWVVESQKRGVDFWTSRRERVNNVQK